MPTGGWRPASRARTAQKLMPIPKDQAVSRDRGPRKCAQPTCIHAVCCVPSIARREPGAQASRFITIGSLPPSSILSSTQCTSFPLDGGERSMQ
jgi:hypothetical protein